MAHFPVAILAILALCAMLAARGVGAEFSVAHLCFLVTTCLLGFLLSWKYGTFIRILGRAPSSNSRQGRGSRKTNVHAPQVNGSLYELHKPNGTPALEILFFHGLYSGDSSEQHLCTWESEDGSCIWPQTWLVEEFPLARILFVSYSGRVGADFNGSMDMTQIVENLISDLMEEKIGETPNCPIILVGHCFGGLVIKQVCLHARYRAPSIGFDRKEKLKMFLNKVGGIFYYGTPHHGIPGLDTAKGLLDSDLLRYFKDLNKDAERLNYEFNQLHRNGYPEWKTAGLGENLRAKSGLFEGLVGAPEESARDGDSFNILPTDHVSICKPRSKRDMRFSALTLLISSIANRSKTVHRSEGLPKHAVDLEARAQEVEGKLQGATVVGICGMGGIGKTTLAKRVFNNISPTFKYTCFVDNVKGIQVHALEDWLLNHFYHCGTKMNKSNTQWLPFKDQKTLIVMDDVDSEDQLRIFPSLQHFGNGSRLIMTSRDREIFKVYDQFDIYEVAFLRQDAARKLFCHHAFSQEEVPLHLPKTKHLMKNVESVVKRCGGLPLTLEVMGRFLRGHEKNAKMWEETISKLKKAQAINGSQNDRVWSSLKVSFDSLLQEEQEMFIEAATIFFEQPLDRAHAAWSTTSWSLETTWTNLVNRSLVKEIIKPYATQKCKQVWVHEQLRDFAMRLTEGSIVSECNDGADICVDHLNVNQLEAKTKMLHLSYWSNSTRNRKKLQVYSLAMIPDLRYMIFEGVLHEGWARGISRNLSLLRWQGNSNLPWSQFPINLNEVHNLAILECGRFEISNEFAEALGRLANLRILSLSDLKALDRLPEDFGNLSLLKTLHLSSLSLLSLPESVGNLSCLVTFTISDCKKLARLPDSFGRGLRALDYLLLDHCPSLKCLPQSFSQLPHLQKLDICSCDNLYDLGDAFGNLSTLKRLQLRKTSLSTLPNTFGHLSALVELTIREAGQLRELPESFGDLSRLVKCSIWGCNKLASLPDSFGRRLKSLKTLEICRCPLIKGLPDSFSQLPKLRKLTIASCEALGGLGDSFGSLSSLRQLSLMCLALQRLPASFSLLCALQKLTLNDLPLNRLPETFGQLTALEELNIIGLPLDTFPDSFDRLTSLRKLVMSRLGLPGLPEYLGEFSRLEELDLHLISVKAINVNLQKLSSLRVLRCTLPAADLLFESFSQLSSLKQLSVSADTLEILPESMEQLSSLDTLNLQVPNMRSLPDSLGKLSSLQELSVTSENLESLSDSIWQLHALSKLNLEVPNVRCIPDRFERLSSLKHLSVDADNMESLPESVGQLSSLNSLNLCVLNMRSLPDSLGKLSSLRELSITSKNFESLPDSIWQIHGLSKLDLQVRNVRGLPDSFGKLSSLKQLSVNADNLESLPESVGQLSSLDTLNLRVAKMRSLPDSLGKISSLQELSIRSRKLESLPESIWALHALNKLDLEMRKMRNLPESLGKLSLLTELSVNAENLGSLPVCIGQLHELSKLYLQVRLVKYLPESLGELSSLRKLSITAESLEVLPESLGKLCSLEDLKISAETLEVLPECMVQLHSLRKLTLGMKNLRHVPESLMQLSSLQEFTFDCDGLQQMPSGFERLALLAQNLTLSGKNIETLREDFITLPCIRVLTLDNFKCLESLPDMPTSLEMLTIKSCNMLESLPESFGHLPNLTTLKLHWCRRLKSLPECLGRPPLAPVTLSQGNGSDEIMRVAEEGSSRTIGTDRLLLEVRHCPLLTDAVLKPLGWVLLQEAASSKVYIRKWHSEDRASP